VPLGGLTRGHEDQGRADSSSIRARAWPSETTRHGGWPRVGPRPRPATPGRPASSVSRSTVPRDRASESSGVTSGPRRASSSHRYADASGPPAGAGRCPRFFVRRVDPVRVEADRDEHQRRVPRNLGQVRLRAAAALLGEQHLAAERPPAIARRPACTATESMGEWQGRTAGRTVISAVRPSGVQSATYSRERRGHVGRVPGRETSRKEILACRGPAGMMVLLPGPVCPPPHGR